MIGLLLACIGSVFNVLTDVSRKKVLDRGYDTLVISFWCKVIALGCYALIAACLFFSGVRLEFPENISVFGLTGPASLTLYFLLNTLLEGTAILLNYRALQVAPLSLCVPFMALTPLFLLPAGYLFLGEEISGGMIMGVLVVTLGSLVINRKLVAGGWLEPLRSIFREKGSRYMLCVALLLTCTAVLDKWFVASGGQRSFGLRVSHSLSLALGKGVLLAVFFMGLALVRRRLQGSAAPIGWVRVWRETPAWLLSAGAFESSVMMLQLVAMQFSVAALIISIKRSGILLACVLGWFVFKERDIQDRVIGSFVMLAGVSLFFLTKPDALGISILDTRGAFAVMAATLVALALVLRLTAVKPVSAVALPAAPSAR